jgi:hypothetical protein
MNVPAAIDTHPPASSHHLAALVLVTGTIPRPPKTSFITSKCFSTVLRKATTIPDLSNICARAGRAVLAGDMWLSDFPDDNPIEQDAFGTPLSFDIQMSVMQVFILEAR